MIKTPKFFNMASSKSGNTVNISINDIIGDFWTNTTPQALSDMLPSDVKNVNVYINSVGGGLHDGFAMYNILKSHSAHVNTFATGIAASSAATVFEAGDTRTVLTGASIFVHNPLVKIMGNAKELRKAAKELDVYQEGIVDIYTEVTGLDRDKVNEMLDEETAMSAKEAKKLGFATNISKKKADVENVSNTARFENIKNEIPEKLKNLLKINNNKTPKPNEVQMEKHEIQNLIDKAVGDVRTGFENKIATLEGNLGDVTNKLKNADTKVLEQEGTINNLKHNALVQNNAAFVDAQIAAGKVYSNQRELEIENLTLRSGNEEQLKKYKDSVSNRQVIVPINQGHLDGKPVVEQDLEDHKEAMNVYKEVGGQNE